MGFMQICVVIDGYRAQLSGNGVHGAYGTFHSLIRLQEAASIGNANQGVNLHAGARGNSGSSLVSSYNVSHGVGASIDSEFIAFTNTITYNGGWGVYAGEYSRINLASTTYSNNSSGNEGSANGGRVYST